MMTENNNGAEIPTMFSHSVKIEQTVKGVRVTIHASANSPMDARQEAVDSYITTLADLKALDIVIAPIEVKEAKA